jgi:hypothetical protein
MKAGNRLREPFIIVLSVVLILSALSFTNTEFATAYFTSRKVDLFSEVKFQHRSIAWVFPDPVFADQVKDSLARVRKERERTAINLFSRDSVGAMDFFYRSVSAIKKNGAKARIAYFGDSFVEGDLVTQDLRRELQQKFGGRGVGFVPITSIVAGFRVTITHSFSSDWTKYDFNEHGGEGHPVGPSGNVFVPAPGSWVRYTGPKSMGPFDGIKLYYGMGNDQARVRVKMDDVPSEQVLDGTRSVNEMVINSSGAVNSVTLTFNCPRPVNIYGASFEDGPGVYVDNYAFRGNSGLPLSSLSSSICTGFDNYFDYDLVVLQYGLNVVGHKLKGYTWYKEALEKIVDHMKEVFPHASILVVGMGDKSYLENGEWNTEPDVLKVLALQKQVAEEKGVAYWSLYENMGGYNSMKHWAEGDTVLANKDHAHPNAKGAKKVGEMLYNKLEEGYEDYKLKME